MSQPQGNFSAAAGKKLCRLDGRFRGRLGCLDPKIMNNDPDAGLSPMSEVKAISRTSPMLADARDEVTIELSFEHGDHKHHNTQ